MTKVTITIGGLHGTTFVLARTTAPRAYDHGGAIALVDVSFSGKTERYILVPQEALDWQRGRNAGGLHALETEDLLLGDQEVASRLWKRLYGDE